MNFLKHLVNNDSGQDMVEYGLLASFISIVAIATLPVIGYLVTNALRLRDVIRSATQ